MSRSPLHRFLLAATEISALVAASLTTVAWSAAPAHASVANPTAIDSIALPAGIQLTAPWIVSNSGVEWTYGTTAGAVGTLVSRDRSSGVFTTQTIGSDEEGALAGAHSPLTDVGVFSVRRPGNGNRMVAVNLATGARLSVRNLAIDENLIRAIAFNATASSYIVGTNTNPARVMKFDVATGNQQVSTILGSGLKDITAFINNGTELLAVLGTNPVKLIPVSRATLALGSVVSLPAGTPTLLDPLVIGTTAYMGTDTAPGRITAIDLTTKTVVGSMSLAADESGARNLVSSADGETLYVTTETSTGTRLVSLTRSTLSREGSIDLGAGEPAISATRYGHRLTIGFSGTRGLRNLSIAPAPETPRDIVVTESDGSLRIEWVPGASVEPVDGYTVTVEGPSEMAECTTSLTTCTIAGLQNGVDYSVRVVAHSVAGFSVPLLGSGNPRTLPEAPVVDTVTRGDGSVRVTWTPGRDGGRPVTEFVATASPTGETCVTSEHSCVITGLPNGTPHTVSVVARTIVGVSSPSTNSEPFTPATTPSVPVIDSIVTGDGTAHLAWTEPTSDGGDRVTSYRVRVWNGDVLAHNHVTTDTQIGLSDLVNGVIYRATVSAINSVGEGEPSISVNVEPFVAPEPPEPPTPEPPVVEPPVVDPPVVDPPVVELAPMSPTALTVLRRTRSHVTVGWVLVDPGSSPVIDYRVETSRFRSRGFRTVLDATGVTPWLDLRRPRTGSLYVRVIAVSDVGESLPSAAKRVVRRR